MKYIEVIFDEVTFTSDAIIVITENTNQFYNFLTYYYCSPRGSLYRIYDSYYKWFRTTNKYLPFDIFQTLHTKLIIFTKDFNHKYIINL